MVILHFPRKKVITSKKKLILGSNKQAYVNQQRIQEMMDKKGYKRENDPLVKAMNSLLSKL
ncbi:MULTISPECIES: hypothetical protein [Oceanobacillus]|uniref:hypothetical protein n=1 Tax=Oceanobacillus TaxID=182709 RepID=UPI0030F74E18